MRIYIENIMQEEVKITKEQRHYIKNVMRSPSDFCVFNETDGEHKATLQGDMLLVGDKIREAQALPYKALAFGLIKSARMRWVFEKATELGVTHFYPLVCDRSQYRDFKTERYESIVIEAVEQCGRCDKPVIMPLTTCCHLCESGGIPAYTGMTSKVTWYYGDPSASLTLTALQPPYGVIIGPEGGFSSQESAYLAQHLQGIKLSPHILRAETAAIVAMSAVL